MHYSVLLFWFGVGALIVSIIGLFVNDKDVMFHDWQLRQWILSFMISVSSILGIILMTKAVCWLMPSKVTVVCSFEVVAAYILQVALFEEPTHWTDLFVSSPGLPCPDEPREDMEEGTKKGLG